MHGHLTSERKEQKKGRRRNRNEKEMMVVMVVIVAVVEEGKGGKLEQKQRQDLRKEKRFRDWQNIQFLILNWVLFFHFRSR